ncbi:MAG: TspO/MBR family protein [Pseudomonadota bacterium]
MNILASKSQLRASLMRWSLFLVPLIVLLGFLSAQLGSPQTVWFQNLNKPSFYPPDIAFPIAWSILYALIGFALAMVASAWGAQGRGIAIIVFGLHFVGNLVWTPVFFGMQDMQTGLYIIGYMAASLIVVMALFARVRKAAALLLVPYLAWTIFAGVLNYQMIVLNPEDGRSTLPDSSVERIEL